MDPPHLILKSQSTPPIQIFTNKSHIFIRNNSNLNILDITSQKILLSIPNNDWSEKLGSFYSEKLKGIVCFSNNGKGLEIYLARSASSSSSKKSSTLPYKTKPKKYILDDLIASVDTSTGIITFKNNQEKFDVGNLLTVGDADQPVTTTSQSKTESQESLQEICQFLKINYKNNIFCRNLIKDKYLCYVEKTGEKKSEKLFLKLVDVDFQEEIFSEEIESGEKGQSKGKSASTSNCQIYCNDDIVVYSDGTGDCYVRRIFVGWGKIIFLFNFSFFCITKISGRKLLFSKL